MATKKSWTDTPCSCAAATAHTSADFMRRHHGDGCLRLLALNTEEANREQEARVAAERAKREQESDEPKGPPPPRVVCTKCPAVATVHHFKLSENTSDVREIWAECHGVHVFGSFYGARMLGEDLLFHKITASAPGHIAIELTTSTKYLRDKNDEMLVRMRYLDATGYLSAGNIDDLFQLAERSMLFWQDHVVRLQARMKKA